MAEKTRTASVNGHFGEFVQGRMGPEGPVVLITLPSGATGVTVVWNRAGPTRTDQMPPDILSADAIARVFRTLLDRPPHGTIRIEAALPPGAGTGVSTAALVALARSLVDVTADRLAALCLPIEGATDPIMYRESGRILWASREGRTLGDLPPVPAFHVVGGLHGPPTQTDPADQRFPDISDLAERWQRAAADPQICAAIATESALRTSRFRNGPDLSALQDVAARLGALGIAMAHTGSARALLFAPGSPAAGAAAEALGSMGLTDIVTFETGDTP